MSDEPDARLHGDLPTKTAAEAASTVPVDGTILTSGFGSVGYPKAIPLALADSDRDLSLTVVSGGSTGAEIDTELAAAGAIARRYPYQSRSPLREQINDREVAFHDINVSEVSDSVQYGGLVDPDVAVIEAVAVGEDWLVPSTSIGSTPAFVECADRLLVEVNRAQPLSLRQVHDNYRPDGPPDRSPIPLTDPAERIGSARIPFESDSLVGVVETDRRDTPYSFRTPSDRDQQIANNFTDFLEDTLSASPVFDESVALQFGVGSLGNALMNALQDAELGDRDLIYYGEVIQDGLLDLIESDLLKSASATSLALSKDGQQRLFDNMNQFVDNIVLRPADVSNHPELIRRFGVIGINSALEVDLYGHVNSTHIRGSDIINGVGGSGDFNRNSLFTVITLPSTAGGGDISRVVPMVPHVDHTEHDVDAIITEQGIADLRGTSPAERAQAIIECCAHPDYRAELRSYIEAASDKSGHIPHDLSQVIKWWKT
jgi:succinyl-CoA:acetate CoA-transferase